TRSHSLSALSGLLVNQVRMKKGMAIIMMAIPVVCRRLAGAMLRKNFGIEFLNDWQEVFLVNHLTGALVPLWEIKEISLVFVPHFVGDASPFGNGILHFCDESVTIDGVRRAHSLEDFIITVLERGVEIVAQIVHPGTRIFGCLNRFHEGGICLSQLTQVVVSHAIKYQLLDWQRQVVPT